MLDSPVDAWYVWIGLSLLGLALVSVAFELPNSPPPDATGPANTIDAVAGSTHAATGDHRIAADEIRIEPHRIGVRDGDVTSRETLAFGPVTPVRTGTVLWEVLQGAHPEHVFDSPAEFRAATEAAREREPTWRPVDDRLAVRSIVWEGIDVTLVGA